MDLRILILTALVAAASAAPRPLSSSQCARQCDGVQPFETQKTYKYSYTVETSSFVNDSSNTQDQPRDASVLKLTCNVEVVAQSSCEVFLRVKDVNVRERSSSGQEINSPKKNDIKNALEAHWLRFAFQNGVVKEVCPEDGEEKWTLNIKRGILSALQSPIPQIPQGVKQPMMNMETDVTGSCPVYLSSSKTGGITKHKTFEGCKDRTILEGSIQAIKLSPYAPVYNVMESMQHCEHSIRAPFIVASSSCRERHQVRPFSKDYTGVVTVVTQDLTFVEQRDGGSAPSGYQQQRQTDIIFEHQMKDTQPDPREAKSMIFSYCQSFTEDDKQMERPEYFSKLIELLDSIDDAGFQAVRQYATDPTTCRGKSDQVKKFFIDAVAMCESTACINGMVGMLSQADLVPSSVAELWVSSLPFVRKPTSEMIPTLMNMVKIEPIQPQVYLSVSSLIHNFCIMEGVDCDNDANFLNALDHFENALDHDCSPSGEMTNDMRLKLIVSLKSVGNIGNIGQANYLSGTLTRCMQRTNDIDIRLAAIESFRRLPCDETERNELTNLYKNTGEDTELRIASYRAMMQCASEQILQVVVETMETEADDQVGSFVMSHLKNLNETSDPQKQELKEVLRSSEVMRRFSRDIRKISRNYEVSYFNDKLMTGASFESNVIFSQKSFLPRSLQLNTTVNVFGYAINVFEIGGRMEGMQHMLESLWGPTGYFQESENKATIIQTLMQYLSPQQQMPPQTGQQQDVRNKRDVDQNRMDNIINQFEVPEEDKPMASTYMKIFGNEIGFMDYDAIKEKFNQWTQNADIMHILGKLATEQTIDVSRSNKMMKISSCIPTIAGLPLSLSVDGNTVTQVSASGRMNILGLMMAPRNLHIEGSIRPSVVVELSTTLQVSAFHTQTGLNHVSRLHSDSVLDGALIIDNGNSMRVKLNVPEEKQTIVHVSSKIFRLHQQDKTEIVGDSQRQFTQEVCTAELTAKYLGVRICSEITMPTVWTTPGSPRMLLAGETDIRMTVAKADPHLTSFEMEVTKMTEKAMVNGEVVLTDVFRLMVGTPNTQVKRTYGIDYSLNRNTRNMILDVESPFKTARIEANVIGEELHKKLDLAFTINPSATDEKRFHLIAEREIENPSEGVTRYIPRFEFTGPKGNNMQVTGSVINNDELRRTDVDLQVLENSRTVMSINGPITRNEGTKKSAYGIEMTIEGKYVEGKLTGQVNRNKNLYTIDVDMQKKLNGQLVQDPWASVSFIYGSNRDDIMFRLENEVEFTAYPDWNYHFEIESEGEGLNHENTIKLCYKGISCSTDNKVVIVQNNTMDVAVDGTTNQTMTLRFNHPAQSKEYEMIQKFRKTVDGSFNVSCLIVDDQVHNNLFDGNLKLSRGGPSGSFGFDMATQERFVSTHNTWTWQTSGRFDFVSTLRRGRPEEKTTTVTLSYAPTMNMHDVDLDIVLADQREINIGSRLENNLDQGMLDFDFTIDKFGVQNWVAINVDYRDNSDDTKWEHRASVDVHTPLVTLAHKRVEGGVKRENNLITTDLQLQYNPQRPKVGVEIIFTNNSNDYDTHGQVDVIFTTVTHQTTFSTAGGYQKKVDEKVCNLMASVNNKALADPGEGKTFGWEMNYSNSSNENRIRHTLDSRAYSPDHEVKWETMFKLVPVTHDLTTSFDFKWVKDQQGLTLSVSMLNTSETTNRRIAIISEVQLPQQHLVMNVNHVRRENYYERTLIVTLNDEEKLNSAFTYTRTITSPQSVCRPNLNIQMNGKTVVFDGAVTRINDIVTHLEGSITHDQDTEPSLSLLMDITPLDQQAPQDGFDLTFNIVNKYITGYDSSFTWSKIFRNAYTATPIGHNTVALSIGGTKKIDLIFSVTAEMPANIPLGGAMPEVDPILVVDLDLSFPAMQDVVFRNLAMNVRYQCAVCEKQLLLKWGDKGADETITIAQTLMMTSQTAGDLDVSITHPFVLPMIYPTFSLGVDFNIMQPSSDVKFEITTADLKKRAIQVVYTISSITPPRKQAAEIILSRTGKDDIKLKGEIKALAPDAIADMTLTIEYSTIQNEHLIINTKLVNRSDATFDRRAKEIEIHVDHPVSNVEIDMFISSNNDTRDISIGLEGTIRVGTEHGAVTLEASWDKRDKQYTIHHVRESLESARMLERETYEMTLTGTLDDKSYGDVKIYELDMTSDFNGNRIPSFFKFDGRDKEIEFDVNFNPDDKSDYYRFKAGYLNSSAITAKIDTRRGLNHIVNASVLFYLQAPKVLYTQINWHPQWPQDLKEGLQNRWSNTVARFHQRENIRFYRNKTAENFLAQWEVFKARNADVKGTVLQLVGALQQKIEPAAILWATRKQNLKTKWSDFKTDMKTSILPYIVQANVTWQARKASWPLIKLKVKTEAENYFEAAGIALEGYKNQCIMPLYGALMMNIGQVGTNVKTDIGNIKLQAVERVQEFKTKVNETIEALRLEMVVNGVKLVTWFKEVNETVYGAVMERYETVKMSVMRNPILVDIIRWGILTKDLIPIQQWNETLRTLYQEFSTSNDFRAIKEFWTEMGQLVEQRRTAMAEYMQMYPRTAWIKDYLLKALVTYSENQQNYKLVKADIENGEIIVLLYLQEELRNLQELPPSWKQSSSNELKNQLVSMAPLLQNQVRTQIMDPQLQKVGIFEAAYLLNLITSNPNMSSYSLMQKLAYDNGVSKVVTVLHALNMLRNPRNWIPPYDAKAMIVHNQHYMTFDRRFYEFAGRCTYLLAHDFLNDNFTIWVDYSDSVGDMTVKKLIVRQGDNVYTVHPDLKVTDGGRIKDLPFQRGNITITRGHNSVKVHNAMGVTVTCTKPYEICQISMSGWYYGQTAGLLGTYDYQAKNDFTLPNNQVEDTIDRFTRNWEVSTSCSTTTNRAHKCTDVDPASEQNQMCKEVFLSMDSKYRIMFDVVDPEPFYQMCVNDMCGLTTKEERQEKMCEVIKAYLSQCPSSTLPMPPPYCVKCETSSGDVIRPYEKPVMIENPVQEADVVIVVEEKRCAEGEIADNLHDLVIRLDTELRRNQINNNRFALVGFGGDGVHDLPHPHTIDGSLFNNASRYRLGVDALEFADDGNNDTLAAILKAANYPFRAGASKNIILVSCSDCQHKQTSYATVADTLVKRGIQFNMVLQHDFNIKSKKNKSSKEKVYGFDDLAVYTAKMAGAATLKGDQSLRKYISEPLNKCTLLAMETNGSVFDADQLDRKGFQEVFVLRMVKYSEPMPCQMCRCVPNNEWVGESVCERCGAVTAKDAFIQAMRESMGDIWTARKDRIVSKY